MSFPTPPWIIIELAFNPETGEIFLTKPTNKPLAELYIQEVIHLGIKQKRMKDKKRRSK